jgi:hypothetical protein
VGLRDIVVDAVYASRPFSISTSGGLMQPMREARDLPWEEAPAWYRSECYELADLIVARLLLAGAPSGPTGRALAGAPSGPTGRALAGAPSGPTGRALAGAPSGPTGRALAGN